MLATSGIASISDIAKKKKKKMSDNVEGSRGTIHILNVVTYALTQKLDQLQTPKTKD